MTQASGFHSISQAIAEETAFTRKAVHQFNILEDGTAVVLCRVHGDLNCARHLIDNHPDVLSSSITGESEGEGLSYMHVQPPDSITDIIELPRTHEVVLDFPLEGVREDTIRVTMIGETNEVLKRALADAPDDVHVTVERIGAYPADQGDISSLLTERQQEILNIAIDLGYYEVPRQATHRDIADRAELNPGTVSEHMQKIEARTFAAVAG